MGFAGKRFTDVCVLHSDLGFVLLRAFCVCVSGFPSELLAFLSQQSCSFSIACRYKLYSLTDTISFVVEESIQRWAHTAVSDGDMRNGSFNSLHRVNGVANVTNAPFIASFSLLY